MEENDLENLNNKELIKILSTLEEMDKELEEEYIEKSGKSEENDL